MKSISFFVLSLVVACNSNPTEGGWQMSADNAADTSDTNEDTEPEVSEYDEDVPDASPDITNDEEDDPACRRSGTWNCKLCDTPADCYDDLEETADLCEKSGADPEDPYICVYKMYGVLSGTGFMNFSGDGLRISETWIHEGNKEKFSSYYDHRRGIYDMEADQVIIDEITPKDPESTGFLSAIPCIDSSGILRRPIPFGDELHCFAQQ